MQTVDLEQLARRLPIEDVVPLLADHGCQHERLDVQEREYGAYQLVWYLANVVSACAVDILGDVGLLREIIVLYQLVLYSKFFK